MNGRVIEKSLKHFLKRNGGYTLAVFVSFLINSEISFCDTSLELKEKYNILELQKEKIQSRLNEIQNEIQKLESENEKTTHILFSPRFEMSHNRQNFKNFAIKFEEKPELPDKKPPIKIGSLIIPITPNIPVDVDFPTSDEALVEEPKIKNLEIKDISFVNIPKDISISVLPISFSPKLDENKFNVTNINKSMLPKLTISSFLGNKITDVNVDDTVSIDITEPNVQDNLDIPLFDVPEFTLNEPKIILPQTLSIDNVVLKSTGLNQNDGIGIVPENSIRGSVVQNLYSYAPQGGKIYIDFTDENISYGLNNFSTSQSNLGKQVMILNGTLNGTANPIDSHYPNDYGLPVGKYALRAKYNPQKFDKNSTAAISSFITDLRNNDALISGTYNIKYSKATGANSSRIFTSINPAGLATNGYSGNEKTVITKITKFDGTLNLTTAPNLQGSLVGFEHQLWDKYNVNVKDGSNNKNIPSHFYQSSAVLLNDGTINLGSKDNIGQDTNMIGFVVDIESGNVYSTGCE